MQEINLTINGNKVKGFHGDTVLQVCKRNNIYIPTLCHLDGLTDTGACRLCVVEIEGERRVNPSCAYPARDGLVIRTHTDKLEKYRRQLLELMFSERNHFCMYCEQSGDCELQKLAYLYQMQNIRYSYMYPSMQVDAGSKDIVMDHNRCILCGRCVRACGEISGMHTLDFTGRGWKTMVSADIDQHLNESSCSQCGACVQACPTGAIMSKRNMFRGKSEGCQQITTVCRECSIGCELNTYVKSNNIIRIEAPDMTTTRSALCKIGRFGFLDKNDERVDSPLCRNKQGVLEKTNLDKALSVISNKLKKSKCAALVSPRISTESMIVLKQLFPDNVDTLDGDRARILAELPADTASIDSILKADCILIIGGNIEETHPVVNSVIRRAVQHNQTKLLVIDSLYDPFGFMTDVFLKPQSGTDSNLLNGISVLLEKESPAKDSNADIQNLSRSTGIEVNRLLYAISLLRSAHNPCLIVSGNASGKQVQAIRQLLKTGKFKFLTLKPAINSLGAWMSGFSKYDIKSSKPEAVFLALGDDKLDPNFLAWLKDIKFLAVQASYVSPVTEIAHVVIPSPSSFERVGTYITTDNRVVKSNPVLSLPDNLKQDADVLTMLLAKINNSGSKSGG